ncbi:MAG: hypothetical protein KJ043_23855, partial [Anaerolineae bacterium]|nr:hypothetical protein [Anaerolineae bacterium]
GWRLVERTETTAILQGVPTNEIFLLVTIFLMIFGIFGGIVNTILVWFFTKEIEAKIQTLANGAIQISVQQIIFTAANDKFLPCPVSPSKKLLMYAYLGLSLIPTAIYLGLLTSQ